MCHPYTYISVDVTFDIACIKYNNGFFYVKCIDKIKKKYIMTLIS